MPAPEVPHVQPDASTATLLEVLDEVGAVIVEG